MTQKKSLPISLRSSDSSSELSSWRRWTKVLCGIYHSHFLFSHPEVLDGILHHFLVSWYYWFNTNNTANTFFLQINIFIYNKNINYWYNSYMNKVIWVDIDEVCAKTIEWIFPAVNTQYSTDFFHATTLNYRDVFGNRLLIDGVPASREQKIQIFNRTILSDDGTFRISPVSWAVEWIRKLTQSWYKVVLITARHPMLMEYTPKWVQHHFWSAVSAILFSNSYHWWTRSKSAICIEESIHIMIEDDLDYALELANHWIKVYLLNKPWNIHRTETHALIHRIHHWSELQLG